MKRDECKKTRYYIEYQKINSIIKNDAEPLSRIDILDKLTYAQISPLQPLAIGAFPYIRQILKKLAFTFDFELFEWSVLPLGVRNINFQ